MLPSKAAFVVMTFAAVQLVAPEARASLTFYTSVSGYDTAATADGIALTSFDFNSVPSANYATSAGLTLDGVNFVGNTGNGGYSLNISPPHFCCNDYNTNDYSLQAPPISSAFYRIPNGSTTITLPAGTEAFSFDAFTVQAGDYTGSGHDTLQLSVGGSVGTTQTTAGSGSGFLGFISTAPVSTATLTGSTPEDFINILDGSVGLGSETTTTYAIPPTSVLVDDGPYTDTLTYQVANPPPQGTVQSNGLYQYSYTLNATDGANLLIPLFNSSDVTDISGANCGFGIPPLANGGTLASLFGTNYHAAIDCQLPSGASTTNLSFSSIYAPTEVTIGLVDQSGVFTPIDPPIPNDGVASVPVPEPSSAALLGSFLLALFLCSRHRTKQAA